MSDPVTIVPKSSPASALAPVESEGAAIIRFAIESKADVAQLRELIALKNQQDDREAKRQFFDAMSQFQSECPPIEKKAKATKAVGDSGTKLLYKYATLDEIARVVTPILRKLGLSFSWDPKIDEKGLMVCSCVVRHRNGHEERSTFTCPIAKDSYLPLSDGQKASGTLTLAKRQSLIAALGLTTCDEDTDDQQTPDDLEKIGPGQEAEILTLLEASGADKAKFLRYFKIEAVADLPVSKFREAMAGLKAKVRK